MRKLERRRVVREVRVEEMEWGREEGGVVGVGGVVVVGGGVDCVVRLEDADLRCCA